MGSQPASRLKRPFIVIRNSKGKGSVVQLTAWLVACRRLSGEIRRALGVNERVAGQIHRESDGASPAARFIALSFLVMRLWLARPDNWMDWFCVSSALMVETLLRRVRMSLVAVPSAIPWTRLPAATRQNQK